MEDVTIFQTINTLLILFGLAILFPIAFAAVLSILYLLVWAVLYCVAVIIGFVWGMILVIKGMVMGAWEWLRKFLS